MEERDTSNLPAPIKLALLEQLPQIDHGTKVRFLGCVQLYDGVNAKVVLTDHFPAAKDKAVFIHVNLAGIIDSLDHDLIQIGAWINVVGYIRRLRSQDKLLAGDRHRSELVDEMSRIAKVDANMIWAAADVRVQAYNDAVHKLQSVSDG